MLLPLVYRRLETKYNASMSLANAHILKMGGSNYLPKSYGGSKRVGECKIDCEHFYILY
jgi:hypothetical protein